MMEEKDKEKLLELILNKGELRNDTFGYSSGLKKGFAEKFGMEDLFARHDKLKEDFHWSDSFEETKRYEEELRTVEKEIAHTAEDVLRREGIDVSDLLREQTEQERKEEVLRQLALSGIDRNTAEKLGLDNAEEMARDGKTFSLFFPDDMVTRDRLEKEGIEYERKEGRLKVQVTAKLMEGVAVKDNDTARKFMKDNGVDFIPLDSGEIKAVKGAQKMLFIPNTWQMNGGQSPNRQLLTSLAKLVGVGAMYVMLTPVGAEMVRLLWNKANDLKRMTGWDKWENTKPLLTAKEEAAIAKGQTVYTMRGNREVYYYAYQGNLCSVNAADIRFPKEIEGVKLKGADIGKLRRGEMLVLQKEDGETFGVRVDVKANDNIRKYRLDMRRGEKMTAVPDRGSKDREILAYVAVKGAAGINEVFSSMAYDEKRSTFLSRYGMNEAYGAYRKAAKENDREAMDKAERKIRNTARFEQGKEFVRKNGIKI